MLVLSAKLKLKINFSGNADPFYWAWLDQAKIPFSEQSRQKVLPLIDDPDFVRDLCMELRKLFRVCHFSPISFNMVCILLYIISIFRLTKAPTRS